MRQIGLALTVLVAAAPASTQEARLTEILAGGEPANRVELREMQGYVQELIERVLPATVSLPGASGVVIPNGYVLTAGHVSVSAGQKIEMTLHDGRVIEGETLGANHGTDTGLIKILSKGEFPTVPMGTTTSLRKGEWCLQLGHPSGAKIGRSAPARLGRVLHIPEGNGWLVSDCTMQGGDSGGPIFDMQGNVIGINSRIADNLAQNMHVPIDAFHREWESLDKGEVIGSMDRRGRSVRFGARYDRKHRGAVKVREVLPGKPAERDGVQAGDIILSVNGTDVKHRREMARLIKEAEDAVELEIRRDGKDVTVTVELRPGLPVMERNDRELRRLRQMRANDAVVSAFRGVVDRVNASTVPIMLEGDRVLLGTVVRADGLVLTKASELEETGLLCHIDGRNVAATWVGSDEDNDLALLRVGAKDLAPIEWADSVPSRGAWLASPDGDGLPVSVGIVSSAPYSHARGYLGVRIDRSSAPPRLDEVVDDSAASRAGLEADDVLLAINGTKLEKANDLRPALRAHPAGTEIKIRVRRGEEEFDVTAKLGFQTEASRQERVWGELSEVRAGFGTVIQHDTVLLPSQCGGPIVDLDGKAVGINIARAGRVETLALPRETVLAAVERILATSDK